MKRHLLALAFVFAGCSTLGQSCSAWTGKNFGADYVVVKREAAAYEPALCWYLANTVVNTEPGGVYWTDRDGRIVHVAGVDYVQITGVDRNATDAAAAILGVDLSRCPGGRYLHAPERLPTLRPGERP